MNYPFSNCKTQTLSVIATATAACVISACGSSGSGSSEALQAQAVDGYLVNSTVYCDGIAQSETTQAAGRFSCPAGTDLFDIRGGIDVGFDEEETSIGELFFGTLSAPSSFPFVTPSSTILVELAKDETGEFDENNLDSALETMRSALGLPDLDPAKDDATATSSAKLNAQIQTVLSEFVDATSDYDTVVKAFSTSLQDAAASTQTIDLVADVGTLLTSMNTELITLNQNLAKDQVELNESSMAITATNDRINRAQNIGGVSQATNERSNSGQIMTINRQTVSVSIQSDGGFTSSFGLSDFESSVLNTAGQYTVRTNGFAKAIGFDRNALTIDATVSMQPVELGFELNATDTGDNRKLSVASNAVLSMTRGDNASIEVNVPSGSVMYVTAYDSNNTRTDASFTVTNERTFSSDNGFVSINLDAIQDKLAENGITGFVERDGNYQVTMVVGAVRIAQENNNGTVLLSPYTVVTDGMTVNGTGFRGYASFTAR